MTRRESGSALDPRVCDEEAASAYLGGVSRSTLFRREREGKIKSVRLGGRRMWLVDSLRSYVDMSLEEGGPDAAA